MDTDEERLSKMVRLAEMVAKENNVSLKVEGSTDRRQVLPGPISLYSASPNNR